MLQPPRPQASPARTGPPPAPAGPPDGRPRPAGAASGPEGASALTRAGAVLVSLAGVACVALGDVVTGPDVNFTLLYLVPVAVATWLGSLVGGVTLAVAASITSVGADVFGHGGRLYPSGVLAWNMVVQLGVYLAAVLLLSSLRGRLEGEQLLARTDALTKVANRRAFIEAAELELERSRRNGRPLTLAYVDVDDFKDVNDTLGHAAGDELLVCVARTLRGSTRAVDAVARLGGDEFGLLLPETDGPTAEALLARLRATLLEAVAARRWRVGFSIGAATFASPPSSADELMARADTLMYQAKRTAKGSICLAVVGAGLPGEPVTTPPPGPVGHA